jgi:hypothetical protein
MYSDKISKEAISKAIDYILTFGADNIFPHQFEYQVIRHFKDEIVEFLSTRELGGYSTSDFFSCLMPKNEKGFRYCIQLHPFDLIIYTAFIFESAQKIESIRVPINSKVVFSYRLNEDLDKDLFVQGGYELFQKHSADLLKNGRYSYMVTTDISDFYNQIYHHMVTNALIQAGVEKKRAEHLEKILGNFTSQQSRGIPVGPAASHLIAEAILADVDNMLLRKGYKYVRYVDDFRIFHRSKGEAIKAIHDLSEYLHSVHKLILNAGKTHILQNEAALKFIEDPRGEEERRKIERAQEIMKDDLFAPWNMILSEYDDPDEELTNYYEEISKRVETEELEKIILELFKKGVEKDEPDFRYVKYALVKAKLIASPMLIDSVLINLTKLAPVFQHVVKYLIKVTTEENIYQIGEQVNLWFGEGEYKNLPFIQIWFLYFITEHKYLDYKSAIEICEKVNDGIKGRYQAILAKKYRLSDWVREKKPFVDSYSPSMRRALIWSAGILPSDEYEHFQRSIQKKYGIESLEARISKYNIQSPELLKTA